MAKNRKARTSTVPKDETKSDKFRRIAKQRVPKAVKAILNIGNLATRSYEFTDEQAGKIEAALKEAMTSVGSRFATALVGADVKAASPEFDI